MTDQEHRPIDLTPYPGSGRRGRGSLKSVAEILVREETLLTSGALMLKQNKANGFMCVSCAWAKPANPHAFEYCENGAKATAWELTPKTIDAAFFADHTVTELRTWSDYRLEEQGRLTEPMRYDAATDRYIPVTWGDAIAAIECAFDGDESRKGRPLLVGPHLARSLLHVRAVRPDLRHQ